MDKQYSIEQFKAAIKKNATVIDNNPLVLINVEEVIAELTHKWEPQEGEYYILETTGECLQYDGEMAFDDGHIRRSLTPDEVPAWERDKAGLEVAIEFIKDHFNPLTDAREKTLAKIRELTG